MRNAYLTGDSVYLRPLERADVNERYLSWLNDPEVNRFIDAAQFPQTIEKLERYVAAVEASPTDVMFAIVTKDDDRHIGNIKLGSIHWVHRHADLGLLIGEKAAWGRGHGVDATRLLLRYAFRHLNLHKVTLWVNTENPGAQRVYEKAGFVVEGRHRSHSFVDGRYLDSLSMGILREEWEAHQAASPKPVPSLR